MKTARQQAGLEERVLYSASKGAVYSLTLAMAADHVREGIRVNCVAPGSADTPWIDRSLSGTPDPAAARAALDAFQPMGRLVTADEVANAIAYLASPLSGASVGTALCASPAVGGEWAPPALPPCTAASQRAQASGRLQAWRWIWASGRLRLNGRPRILLQSKKQAPLTMRRTRRS